MVRNSLSSRYFCWHLLVAIFCLGAALVQAQELDRSLGEQVVMMPDQGAGKPALEVTVFKPTGTGPFPVVVFNHGREESDANLQSRARPLVFAKEFVLHGYAVVVPMMPGFSKSKGQDISVGCSFYRNGQRQAANVRRVLSWLETQRWADVSNNAVMGQSYGGLVTLAYGMDPHPGTKLLVNFAGGLKNESCPQWEQTLIQGLGAYGQHTRLPSLWFYGTNDSYFPPHVHHAAFDRYTKAGGKAVLYGIGNFADDAHFLIVYPEGLPLWRDKVMNAMRMHGLPVPKLRVLPASLMVLTDVPTPATTGFAKINEINKVPMLSAKGRESYANWLRERPPKAFAVDPATGAYGFSTGGPRVNARALAYCQEYARSECRLYAVNHEVVWIAK